MKPTTGDGGRCRRLWCFAIKAPQATVVDVGGFMVSGDTENAAAGTGRVQLCGDNVGFVETLARFGHDTLHFILLLLHVPNVMFFLVVFGILQTLAQC